ncbi:MAG TPA: hypothetical protein VFO29_12130 [Candidatus Rubrimentiphilum sp.]|nr:hypothetical protein [Candidatus Rubrimentiphilum sp.]
MYYYVEYLRAYRALRVIAIILAVSLALTVLFRLWAFSASTPEKLAQSLQSSPTAHVTTSRLADGTLRTVVDDPVKDTHAVIERRGQTFRMDATVPSADAPRHNHFSVGTFVIDKKQNGGTAHVIANYDMDVQIGLGEFFAVSSIIGLITATMLGGALAKENESHLELAWSKPVSRDRLALASIAVDMAAIVISQLVTVVLALLLMLMFVTPHVFVNALTPSAIALSLLGPLAWYACLTAFSASLKRGLGLVVGLGWLAAIVVPAVATGTSLSSVTAIQAIHAVFQAASYIDPISYLSFHGSVSGSGLTLRTSIGTLGISALALFFLTIAYVAAAVLQWRRVEA